MTKHLSKSPMNQASVFDHQIQSKVKSLKPHDLDAITMVSKTIEQVRQTGGHLLK